jgi:hypothetical protein
MVETKGLTVRLTGCGVYPVAPQDYQTDYDGSDSVYLDAYEKQHNDAINEDLQKHADDWDYQNWLIEQSAKVKPANVPGDRFNRLANHERTAEMRHNRMTQEQIYYRG